MGGHGLSLPPQRVPGVVETKSGYTQGKVENPTYEQVCSGGTGHTEAVLVTYNPKECAFADLLEVFEQRVDMTQLNRQGNDIGTQVGAGWVRRAGCTLGAAGPCREAAPPHRAAVPLWHLSPQRGAASGGGGVHRGQAEGGREGEGSAAHCEWTALIAPLFSPIRSFLAAPQVATEVKPATTFYIAEDYHQQYLEKGGRFGRKQSAAKGCNDPIRCYG